MTTGSFGYHGGGAGGSGGGSGVVGDGFVSGHWYPLFSASLVDVDGGATARGRIWFVQFTVAKTRTFHAIGFHLHTGHAGTVVRLGIYSDTGTVAPHKLLHDFGTIATTATHSATNRIITITVTLTPGRYWLCGVQQGTGTTPLGVTGGAAPQWYYMAMGGEQLVTTTNMPASGWRSTAATFTGPLPATAPTLTFSTTLYAIQVKAA